MRVAGRFEMRDIICQGILDIEGDPRALSRRGTLDTEMDLIRAKRCAGLTDAREVQRTRLAVERADTQDTGRASCITMEEQIRGLRDFRAEQQARDGVRIKRTGSTAPALLALRGTRRIRRVAGRHGFAPLLRPLGHAICPTHGHSDTLSKRDSAARGQSLVRTNKYFQY